jgi:hypothetical protein
MRLTKKHINTNAIVPREHIHNKSNLKYCTMDFVYVNGGPETPEEKKVAKADYIWVRTNSIQATQHGRPFDPCRPDRLKCHSHHGEQTHVIVQGDLDLEIVGGAAPRHIKISTARGAAKEGIVPPNVTYKATSDGGATFIEGHKYLSPRTAERFIARGTLKAVAVKGSEFRLPDENHLKAWLRQVDFNPDGKVAPNLLKGEKPILGYHPNMPQDVHLALSNWFAKEWQKPKDQFETLGAASVLVAVLAFILGFLLTRRGIF